ncbi:MAG: hypothetical protein DCC75_00410 [Proteobacteria bacterium]|nr:MAG: hypothetical protein DCC75_00410 [Pseudomonadota bacterium]
MPAGSLRSLATLKSVITLIALALIVRVFLAAVESSNWRGFTITSFHIIVVAMAAYWALTRSCGSSVKKEQ